MSVSKKLTEYFGFPVARAYLPNHRSSAFKARLVADLIRSKSVVEALSILALTQKRIARVFDKLLRSALANALNNHGMEVEGLYLFRVIVNEAKTLKRFRPILRGRSAKIRKRGCHLEILLAQKIVAPKEGDGLPETLQIPPAETPVPPATILQTEEPTNTLKEQLSQEPSKEESKEEKLTQQNSTNVAKAEGQNLQDSGETTSQDTLTKPENKTVKQTAQGGKNGTES